jgi:flagellar motor component MotA
MEWEQAFKIIELLIIIVAIFLLHNSFPAGKVKELIELLKVETKKTETPVDDLLLQVVALLNDLREQQQPTPPDTPAADSGGELNPVE